jgi:serine/threonine protein kinase
MTGPFVTPDQASGLEMFAVVTVGAVRVHSRWSRDSNSVGVARDRSNHLLSPLAGQAGVRPGRQVTCEPGADREETPMTAKSLLMPGDPYRLGDYQLLGRLGVGGMGTVYLAEAPDGERVAVKCVRPEFAADVEFRERFRQEVQRAREVPPFCTAEVIDADFDAERPFLVVEYIDGPTLAEAVNAHGPLRRGNLHAVALGVANALTAIHGAGVVHRDLKPSNVLLAPGSPKVIDFGIARAMEPTSRYTRTGQLIGTVEYMAPERFDGRGADVGAPGDVFAWGAVVAYSANARSPFDAGSAMGTAARILTGEPELTGLTGPLRDLVYAALQKDPGQRPTAVDLVNAMLTAADQERAVAGTAGGSLPGRRRKPAEPGSVSPDASPRRVFSRAAEADRQDAARVLRRAVDDGRLDLDEFDERFQRVIAARTRETLDGMLADLPSYDQPESWQQPSPRSATPPQRGRTERTLRAPHRRTAMGAAAVGTLAVGNMVMGGYMPSPEVVVGSVVAVAGGALLHRMMRRERQRDSNRQ